MSDNRLELPPNTLHRCRACKCLWRRWVSDGTWSLADAEQRACARCDNSSEFISLLDPPPEIDLRRQLAEAREEIDRLGICVETLRTNRDALARGEATALRLSAAAQAQAAALREALRVIATQSLYEEDEHSDTLKDIIDAACVCARQALAAMEEMQP